MLGRVSALLILGLAGIEGVAGCNRDGPEDPAIADPGAGIPIGAVGAAGVGFDAVPPSASGTPRVEAPRPQRRKGDPRPVPVDPFADPPDRDHHPRRGASTADGGPPGDNPHAHPSRETTL